jgi:hypothetical protein
MRQNITAPEERRHLRGKQTEGTAGLPPGNGKPSKKQKKRRARLRLLTPRGSFYGCARWHGSGADTSVEQRKS